jgi:hypothetical protein
MDVGGWLRGLGLGQYEANFRDNKIDADLLPRLTVDDLKDIGVSVVGDRRRLLDAIAVIAGAGPPANLPASPTKSAPSKGLQASAERRPITVMFCDLVGSSRSFFTGCTSLVSRWSASRADRPTRRSSHLPPKRPTAMTREGWRIWPALASSSPCT